MRRRLRSAVCCSGMPIDPRGDSEQGRPDGRLQLSSGLCKWPQAHIRESTSRWTAARATTVDTPGPARCSSLASVLTPPRQRHNPAARHSPSVPMELVKPIGNILQVAAYCGRSACSRRPAIGRVAGGCKEPRLARLLLELARQKESKRRVEGGWKVGERNMAKGGSKGQRKVSEASVRSAKGQRKVSERPGFRQ